MSHTSTVPGTSSQAPGGATGWAARYTAAEEALNRAREFIAYAREESRISAGEQARYTAMLEEAYQAALRKHITPKARAEAAEAACTAIRAQAIALYHAHDICEGGLTGFLDNAGLAPYDD